MVRPQCLTRVDATNVHSYNAMGIQNLAGKHTYSHVVAAVFAAFVKRRGSKNPKVNIAIFMYLGMSKHYMFPSFPDTKFHLNFKVTVFASCYNPAMVPFLPDPS